MLGHQGNERKGWKVSGTKDGGFGRHHFWREGDDLEDHIPWMLDGEGKKRKKQAIEIKGPLKRKEIHKIKRHIPRCPLPKRHHLLNRQFPVLREDAHKLRNLVGSHLCPHRIISYCWSSHENIRHFKMNRKLQAHVKSANVEEFIVMKRN